MDAESHASPHVQGPGILHISNVVYILFTVSGSQKSCVWIHRSDGTKWRGQGPVLASEEADDGLCKFSPPAISPHLPCCAPRQSAGTSSRLFTSYVGPETKFLLVAWHWPTLSVLSYTVEPTGKDLHVNHSGKWRNCSLIRCKHSKPVRRKDFANCKTFANNKTHEFAIM